MLFIGDLPTQCLSGRILIFMIYKLKLSAKSSFLKGFQLSFKFLFFFLDHVTLSQISADPEVTVTGGYGPNEGNIMIGGRPVCDDLWSQEDAQVVCRFDFLHPSFV